MIGKPSSPNDGKRQAKKTKIMRPDSSCTRNSSFDFSKEKSVDDSATLNGILPVTRSGSNSKQNLTSSSYSGFRRYSLLVLFCLSQFLDIFNLYALISGIPTIAADFGMTGSESVWSISALQLTFASFLLISGRLSDVYSAKWAFITGLIGLGLLDLGLGFVKNKIGFFVLRAVAGIFSALTIPSALNMIVNLFPDPVEQSSALSAFGATGSIANVIGAVIGAILVQLASWKWIFFLVTITALSIAAISVFLIPRDSDLRGDNELVGSERISTIQKVQKLDLPGVAILTSALVLLVYSLTQGSNTHWASAGVLVPLILSIILLAAFVYFETLIPEEYASVPPSTWFLTNFSVLFGTALLPYFYFSTMFLVYIQYWQDVYHWTAISAAIHLLPPGVVALLMSFTGSLSNKINPKWLILFGNTLAFAGTVLFPFSGKENRYWPLVFPGLVIGSAGMMITYVHSNIAIFRSTPSRMSGVVGALYNSACQIGSAVGTAAVTSIATSLEKKDANGFTKFDGRAASFWFVLAAIVVVTVAVGVFYRIERDPVMMATDEKTITKEDTMSSAAA